MYKLSDREIVIRLTDNAEIPKSDGNSDYQQYLVWLSQGNTPFPADSSDQNASILTQIDSIERQYLMNRGSREGWIALIEQQGASAGMTEAQLLDPVNGNRFYIKLREVDSEIRTLRSQLV